MKTSWLLIPGLLLLFGCSEPKKESGQTEEDATVPLEIRDTFSISVVIPVVECRKNAACSYALYLPHQYDGSTRLPALIFADPHGDGAFPLQNYSALAEKFGVILIGSNDSKNGVTFSQTTPAIQLLVEEASVRLSADERQISFAGFSGGAKAVLVAAAETPSLHSVIYCGAGLPEIPSRLPPALGIAGLKDMNYTDVIQTDQQLEDRQITHALIEWNGKHEWSDAIIFQNAFYWPLFRAMEKKIIPVDENLVKVFVNQNLKTGVNPLHEEMRLKKLISFLEGVSDISGYVLSLESLRKQKKFLSAREKQKSDFELESRMKQNYLQCIDLKDVLWWRDEVIHLMMQKGNPMNDRILGYISLACYSYSSNALKQQNYKGAEKYLAIYSFVDRENTDRAFMQACLYGYMKNKAGALQSIREAIDYGFNDKSKLTGEPSLAFIRNSAEFNILVQEIK
jgi:hypothetical protein